MSGTQTTTGQAPTSAQLSQMNAQNRALVLHNGLPMLQKIYSSTFVPSAGNVLNIPPRYVGLIRGFWVKVLMTISNTGTGAITPTELNVANALSQIVLTDLDNYVRINTSGWHLRMVNTAKAKRPFGSAYTTDAVDGYGTAYAPFLAPSSIAASSTGTAEMWYYVPLAYQENDLRGAIYANVVNATMNLQLTINPNVVAANTVTDNTLYMYTGGSAAAGSISSCTVTVYQDFIDQLPVGKNGVILPFADLSSIYELKNTNLTGLSTGQDFPMPYTNFRDFLSTAFIFDNGGTLNAGTDINYIALQSANFTNIFQVEPQVIALKARNKIMVDTPKGMYYIDHRDKPISTVQFGNMELIVNASTVNTGAVMLIGYEDMGMKNTIIPAGSLPGG